jgi:amidase
MNFEEYRAYDATGLAKLVADKEVTAAELLALAQARAAAVNPRINAIVRDVPASPPSELRGPFAGVPFLIKDIAQERYSAGMSTPVG